MPLFSSNPPNVKEYQRYRKAGRELHQKMIEAYVDKPVIEKAAKLLKLGEGGRLVLDSEGEMDVLMDFALYDLRQDGKNIVARYAEEKGGKNFIERELLSAMTKANVGLFKVVGVNQDTCRLKLGNLIDVGQTVILTDINFSQTLPKGLLLFLRPIRFPKLAMTSGVAFVFPPKLEQELVTHWRELETKDLQRYAWFFRRSKHAGYETMYV